ncbi:MAG: excinuclease ABC subunit UvrA, partial [Alistipes sp.]|nr:excinuclease ABC subunit UvrA [Alistipes sp.]
TDDVVEYITALGEGSRVYIAVPLRLKSGQGLIDKLLQLVADGILRLYIGGELVLLEDFIPTVTDKTSTADTYIVIDRLKVATDDDTLNRLRESVSGAFGYGTNSCVVIADGKLVEFSALMTADGIEFEHLSEHLFGFNNPLGACPVCEGFGRVTGIDEDLVIPDKSRSIFDNAIACWRGESMSRFRDKLVQNAYKFDFPIHEPYYKLTEEQRRLLWTGNEYFDGLNAFFDYLEREKKRHKTQFSILKARYTGKTLCPACNGARLRPEALYVKVGGKDIAQLAAMTVDSLIEFFDTLSLDEHDTTTAQRILVEIKNRLQYLSDVGLGYLTLNRLSSTLSGGESQRINLSTSLGSNLTGSLYILDEPSIGLHPRDTARLITVLKQLRDLGNTVIVVEHEEEIIRAADYIVDIGPQAGENGGKVVYSGDYDKLSKATESLTADYLCGRKSILAPQFVRPWSNYICINGARVNNLKNISVKIPLGVMTCITGVSGSGKSSLVKGILYPALRRAIMETGENPGDFDGMSGDMKMIRGIELVDQNPIGKSSRSNPVTYIKAYDEIRRLYADQPYAQRTNIQPSHFSFNMVGGRCEQCQGEGTIKIGMQFMADVTLTCDACNGRRFKQEILDIKYRDKDICDVLDMSIDQAIEFFGADSKSNNTCRRIVERLKPLQDVGLGYVKLGQSSSTLSGGESQRVKLASFLTKDTGRGSIVFIFDEPTTGLHFHDIKRLLAAFDALIANGHTVVIVEHNMDIIKCADHIIDLGPEAGYDGGEVVFEGTPKDLIDCKSSYTGSYLKQHLK